MFTATHHPGKAQYEAAAMHVIQAGQRCKISKGVIARAATPGGIFRQLFAQWRHEMKVGTVSENLIVIANAR